MTTLTLDLPAGPATHALVIGCGRYFHLPEGGGKPAANNWGLQQLGTAPVSARHFVDWLLHRFHNSKAPLASIEHLISSGGVFSVR